MATKNQEKICKRTDTGVVALIFDEQEGKYICTDYPNTLEYLRVSELEDPSERYRPVAYIEISNDKNGYPREGIQVPLREEERSDDGITEFGGTDQEGDE